MSIWTIQESERAIFFVEHTAKPQQCWKLRNFIATDFHSSPVQLPYIGDYDGYENCFWWPKYGKDAHKIWGV